MLLFKQKWPDQVNLTINDQIVPVAIRQHPRARSYRLTLPSNGRPVLTVPKNGRFSEAEAFLHRQRTWLGGRLKRSGGPRPFADGTVLSLRGVDHHIIGRDVLRGQVEILPGETGPRLSVPGGPAHLARRLTDWLKAQALADLEPQVARHAETLGVRPTGIRMRGQSSRWGSCSSAGRLNFNWRLVLAPPHVLDYVAAHEVAHLVEMNHSAAFWEQVAIALPDMERGRAWLRAYGHELMRYGVQD